MFLPRAKVQLAMCRGDTLSPVPNGWGQACILLDDKFLSLWFSHKQRLCCDSVVLVVDCDVGRE